MTRIFNDGSALRTLRKRLAGHRILVAGRSSFHLVLLTDLLQEAGCSISGPFRTVGEVVAAVPAERPDVGIVDFAGVATRLLDIKDWLEGHDVPCVLVGSSIPGSPLTSRVVPWPIDEEALLRALLECIDAIGRTPLAVGRDPLAEPGLHPSQVQP